VGGAGRAAVAPTNVFSVRGRRLGPEVRGSVCVSAEMLGGSRNLHLHGPQMQGGALARVTPTLLNAAMGRMAQWALPLTGTRRLSTVHATDPSTTATTATDDGASPATTTPTTVVRPSTAIKQRLFAVVQLNGKQYKVRAGCRHPRAVLLVVDGGGWWGAPFVGCGRERESVCVCASRALYSLTLSLTLNHYACLSALPCR
jgi:hypothetical protein